MARSSGRRSAPAPRPAARPVHSAPPPMKTQSAPAPVQSQPTGPGIVGGMMGMIGQGLAFGTGSAVAHRAVDAVMGPRTVTHEHTGAQESPAPAAAASSASSVSQDSCGWQTKAFQDCVQQNTSDVSKCQFYLDMLSECKKTSATASTL